jgi:hypothetical protein
MGREVKRQEERKYTFHLFITCDTPPRVAFTNRSSLLWQAKSWIARE